MIKHPESIKALKDISGLALNKRVVFVAGNFNIIHPGHLRLLRFARECGDFLAVGVLDSSSPGAVVQESLRLEGISAISWVDYGFILHDTPESFITELKPAFVVKGKEHEEKYNPEVEVLAKTGGKLLFGSGDITFSSVDMMQKEWKDLNFSTIKKPRDFPGRHVFNNNDLLDIIDNMKKLRVCVIGDTIVDEYITCEPLGMSQEDPTIVVTPIAREKFIGGAAIVAAHAQGLGARVRFYSVAGNDEIAVYAGEILKQHGIRAHLYRDESRPTTLKQRYRASEKTLLRVSHLRQHSIPAELRDRIFDDIKTVLDDIDLVIFSDFNYGCLPQSIVDHIVEICARKNIMMAADSQSSSQVGDITRFKNMALITPTEREARVAMHDADAGLVILAEKLRQKANARNVIITIGAEGILIHAETSGRNNWLTDRLPAFNTSPKDMAGAGDSFLTCSSMSMALGYDIWKSAYLGSLAAACQVGRIGNLPLTPDDLKTEILNGN